MQIKRQKDKYLDRKINIQIERLIYRQKDKRTYIKPDPCLQVWTKRGLLITDPIERGLRVVEISVLTEQASIPQTGPDWQVNQQM